MLTANHFSAKYFSSQPAKDIDYANSWQLSMLAGIENRFLCEDCHMNECVQVNMDYSCKCME